jgi:sec-independent protein translocase protein TatC
MMPLLPERASHTPTEEELARMSLMDHLEELRKRLIWSLLALSVAFFPCWGYREEIVAFLSRPLRADHPELKLAFLGIVDPFILYFKVAGLAAVFLASPVILYQLWLFVAPGLYRKEKMYAIPFITSATFFFVAGGAFGYYVAFPSAVQFLLEMGKQFAPVITIERYFSFLITVILGLGLMFELPIVVLILAAIGVVTPQFLLRQWRYAVVIIFIISAIITPTPDIVNLCIFAMPACALYFLGIGAAFMVAPKRPKED